LTKTKTKKFLGQHGIRFSLPGIAGADAKVRAPLNPWEGKNR